MKLLRLMLLAMLVSGVARAHGIHDIAIMMTGPPFVTLGQRFTYDISVRNGGLGDPAYGIVVTQTLPTEVGVFTIDGGPFRCTLSKSRTTLTCSADEIPWGGTTIHVEAAAPGRAMRLV